MLYYVAVLKDMERLWPDWPDDGDYIPVAEASAFTGLDYVQLNRLSKPGGPIRCFRPKSNRRLVCFHDLVRYIKAQNPHLGLSRSERP